ncbi:MAG TPA: (2Fe-2S)-binding protein, partial [Bacillota bacterium]|nr:(2Fe-2S)-binding protein [Bacillota bacterium]HPZ22185.1 (2Fe-2S)-binding protein [Bacillota bacterium]
LREREEWIKENPLYGRIICRCEGVSEGEIVDALHRPLPARTLDGIKIRTRAGTGRCQGSFCQPRLLAIVARELGISPLAVTKSGPGSEMLANFLAKGGGQ